MSPFRAESEADELRVVRPTEMHQRAGIKFHRTWDLMQEGALSMSARIPCGEPQSASLSTWTPAVNAGYQVLLAQPAMPPRLRRP